VLPQCFSNFARLKCRLGAYFLRPFLMGLRGETSSARWTHHRISSQQLNHLSTVTPPKKSRHRTGIQLNMQLLVFVECLLEFHLHLASSGLAATSDSLR
jgi:hypothetical protein